MGNDSFIKRDADYFTQAASKVMGQGASYALLNLLAYPGVGDSLIWLGTAALRSVTIVSPRLEDGRPMDCVR